MRREGSKQYTSLFEHFAVPAEEARAGVAMNRDLLPGDREKIVTVSLAMNGWSLRPYLFP